jgi:hypothetical protein
MNQIQERNKLRQKYLDRRTEIYSEMAMSALRTLLGIATLALLASSFLDPKFYRYHLGSVVIFAIAATFLFGVAVIRSVARHSRMRRELHAIPYVPPVTPDTLPATEILMRGSEAPTLQSEVLLRGAQKGEETPKEELLRVSQE